MLGHDTTQLACLGLAAALCAGCSDSEPSDAQPTPAALFGDSIDRVVVEVDYMEGAEPYTGEVAAGRPDVWELFGSNVDALFDPAHKSVEYPTTLQGMEALPNPGRDSYSVSEILELAEQYRDERNGGGTASFYFVWVDGKFRDEDGVQDFVLGASIGTTGVVAMFKPVIAGATLLPAVARFGEQTTLIHEFGHSVGLVNNGLPLATDHHDREHGAHCTNRDCVMYWALESVADVVEFARNLDTTGSTVVFGSECLADVEAISPD